MSIGNKGGAPTKYKPEYCDKVDEYIKQNQDEYRQVIKFEGQKSTGYEQKLTVKLPTFEGFSLMLGVSLGTMEGWKRAHKQFSMALEKIKEEQKKRLVNMGLSGDYNSTIAKLILSANHGMREVQEVKNEHSGIIQQVHSTNLDNYKKAQEIAKKYEDELLKSLSKK